MILSFRFGMLFSVKVMRVCYWFGCQNMSGVPNGGTYLIWIESKCDLYAPWQLDQLLDVMHCHLLRIRLPTEEGRLCITHGFVRHECQTISLAYWHWLVREYPSPIHLWCW